MTGPAPTHGRNTPPDDDVFWQDACVPQSDGSRAVDEALLATFPAMYDEVEQLAETQLSTTWKALNRHTKTYEVIKAPTLAVLDNDRLREQFRQEVQIAARLDHPGIVPLRYPSLDNQPWFFTMPFIDGMHLDQHCADRQLDIRERVQVFLKICDAVSYAHDQGVLHRDLKPNNIRVSGDGQPKLLDFGIGRFLTRESAGAQQSRSPVTPAYMAPEQADGAPGSMRTDIYALGVILYELLTGRLPFDAKGKTWHEHVRQIQQEPPVAPKEIRPEIGGELDAIILKAMARHPDDRYATVAQFARDIREFLDGGIIDVWRNRRGYVLRKTVRRYRVAIAILGAFVVLLAVSATAFWRQSRELRRRDYFNRIALAENALRSSNAARTKDLLRGCPENLRAWEWRWLIRLSDRSLDHWDVNSGPLPSLAVSPNGSMVAAGARDGTVSIVEASTGLVAHTMHHSDGPIRSAAFSPDGTWLATAGPDARVLLWDATTGEMDGEVVSRAQLITCVAFAPDGQSIATANNAYDVEVWNVESGELLAELKGHADYVNALCFNPDGLQLASGSSDGTVRIWDSSTGYQIAQLDSHGDEVRCVAFSPEGSQLASGGDEFLVRIWNVKGWSEATILHGHADVVRGLAYHPDGNVLASASFDNTVRLWDLSTGTETINLTGHDSIVFAVAFSPDGHMIFSTSEDGTVRSWDAGLRSNVLHLQGHWHGVNSVVFNEDATRLLTASGDRTVRLWDATSGEELATLRGHSGYVNAAAFAPGGDRVASASSDRTIRIWELADARSIVVEGHEDEVTDVVFSRDGKTLFSSSKDGTIASWSADSGQKRLQWTAHDGPVRRISLNESGDRIASAGDDGTVRIWETSSGALAQTLVGHEHGVSFVRFGLSDWIASSDNVGVVVLWNAKSGKLVQRLGTQRDPVTSVVFSPDGRRVFTFVRDGVVRVWEVATGAEVISLPFPDAEFLCGAISPDGRSLAAGGSEGLLWIMETDKVTPSVATQRRHTRDLARLVDALFDRYYTVGGIKEAFASDATLGGDQWDLAIEHVHRRGDDPILLRGRAWDIVSHPGQEQESYTRALDTAQAAFDVLPEDSPDRAGALRTLGIAHYRLGNTRDALHLLQHSYQLERRSPATLAFLAMAEKVQGFDSEAEAKLEELRLLLQHPDFKPHRYLERFFNESEAVVLAKSND